MQPSVPAASHDVGDVEHDLELVKMWTSAARQAAGLWLREIHSARAAQRSVDDALAELRRLSVEIEKLEDLELSICVWEAILVVVHLRESLGGEVEPIVHAACELLAKRENALDRAIRSVQPVVIWDVRTAA